MTTAIEFVWRAMGEPAACETDGTEMRPRAMGGARCAATGLPAEFRIDDAISDKFTTVTNRARWLPFGGGALHRSAVWACKALAFRAGSWFARESGVWWYPIRPLPGLKTPPRLRPDALEVLLSPPEPPFAAGLPLYGIDHGGEMHIERCVRWTDGRAHVEARPLAKLQSKHTLLYARVSSSSMRYHLQVDDALSVAVDVAAWRRLKGHADALLAEMRAGGVGATEARLAIERAACPRSCPMSLVARWPSAMRPFESVRGAPWWPLFVSLLRMPELDESTRRPRAPAPAARVVAAPPMTLAPVPVPVPVHVAAEPRKPQQMRLL